MVNRVQDCYYREENVIREHVFYFISYSRGYASILKMCYMSLVYMISLTVKTLSQFK